jgi:hypothetical protein
MSIQERNKKPSKELNQLIRQSIKTLVKFPELWKKVQEKGYAEGFDEKELQDLVMPYLKQRSTTEQIKHLFDNERENSQTLAAVDEAQ